MANRDNYLRFRGPDMLSFHTVYSLRAVSRSQHAIPSVAHPSSRLSKVVYLRCRPACASYVGKLVIIAGLVCASVEWGRLFRQSNANLHFSGKSNLPALLVHTLVPRLRSLFLDQDTHAGLQYRYYLCDSKARI